MKGERGEKLALICNQTSRGAAIIPLGALLCGCNGIQSALDPAGPQAHSLAKLFWWMSIGTAVIWLGMIAITLYAIRAKPDPKRTVKRARMLIVIGGVAVPVVVLSGLLVFGLAMLPPMVAPAPEGSLKITVIGEQWWWRVRYSKEGQPVELANEIRLPLGEPVQFVLFSSNVIHSFWIPSLGGKRDMVPGRATQIALTASRKGFFRGVCAEYCGTSHALMSFPVLVLGKEEFTTWLDQQSTNAREPENPLARKGERAFMQNGCGACHTIRGTRAAGVIAPDLTHLGSRLTVGAGVMTNDAKALERWIKHPDKYKPAVHMPAFGMIPGEEIEAIAEYLKELK